MKLKRNHIASAWKFAAAPPSLFVWSGLVVCLVAPLGLAEDDEKEYPITRLHAVMPAGGQTGTDVDVVVTSGTHLQGLQKMVFSHPGITAKAKVIKAETKWPIPKRLDKTYTVSIAEDVPLGAHDVWVIGTHGISNARLFIVGAREEHLEDNNQSFTNAQEISVGTVVNGASQNGGIDYYQFKATKGQRILIDCYADRIGSRMDPTLILCDESGAEVIANHDTNLRDPFIDFVVGADATYVIKIHDVGYLGGPQYFYRLNLSDGPYIDWVEPSAISLTQETSSTVDLMVYGRNLPGGTPAEGVLIHGVQLEQTAVSIDLSKEMDQTDIMRSRLVNGSECLVDAMSYQLETDGGWTNSVYLGFASAPLVFEEEPNDQPSNAQAIEVPAEIQGNFDSLRDFDWFTFQASKGDVYRIDLFSHRMGHSSDAFMLIQQLVEEEVAQDMEGQNPKSPKTGEDNQDERLSKDLHEIDDLPSGLSRRFKYMTLFYTDSFDPGVDFTAPADASYRIMVRNQVSSPGRHAAYRLSIHEPQPDYRLITQRHELNWGPGNDGPNQCNYRPVQLHRGGANMIDVYAVRRDGFEASIDVWIESLPEGVTCEAVTIQAGRNHTQLFLRAGEDAKQWSGPIVVKGKARIGEIEVIREARAAEIHWDGSWGRKEWPVTRLVAATMLHIDGERPFPFRIQPVGTPPFSVSRAGKIEVPLEITRRDGYEDYKLEIEVLRGHLPEHIKSEMISVEKGKNTAVATFEIGPEADAEPHALMLVAKEASVSVMRDPGAAAEAREAKIKITQALTELTSAAAEAEEAEQRAHQNLEKAKAEHEQAVAETSVQQVEKVSVDESGEQGGQATATLEKKGPEGEFPAVNPADVSADLREAPPASDLPISDSQAKVNAAVEAKATAQQAVKETKAKVEGAKEALKQVQQSLEKAQDAKPKWFKFNPPVMQVVLEVKPGPVELQVDSPKVSLRQGESLDLVVGIERLFDFEGDIQLKLDSLEQAKGVQLDGESITVSKGQKQGKLTIIAAEDAAVGEFPITLKAHVKFNAHDLVVPQPIELQVTDRSPELPKDGQMASNDRETISDE